MSQDTNIVIITARLTRDPEGKSLNSGTNLADLGVAVNESWFDKQTQERKENTHFVDVTFFGQPADFACQYLKKGDKVIIEAALDMQSWTDRDSGQKRSKLKLKGRRIQSLMTKVTDHPQNNPQQSNNPPPQQSNTPMSKQVPSEWPDSDSIPGLESGEESIEDIPFN